LSNLYKALCFKSANKIVKGPANIALPIGIGKKFNELEDQLIFSGTLAEVGSSTIETVHFTFFQFDSKGRLSIVETGPGDGIVLRTSALLDERQENNLTSRLISPIKWIQVLFLFSDHLGLTQNPAFTDNLLYFLMESQRG
jgi:hypothetical protein